MTGKATVPGGIYSDLERNGILSNPLQSNNDVNYRWVSLDGWTYEKTFDGKVAESLREKVFSFLFNFICGIIRFSPK